MSIRKASSRFKMWYRGHSSWIGWLGLLLVALSFVSKEVLPEFVKSEEGKIDKISSLLENDEVEQRQIENTRTYGIEKSDILESILIRLEETYKLDANDGYYIARIERLTESDSTAKSGFLNSRHLDVGRLKMVPKGIFNSSFATIMNIDQVRRAQRRSEKQLFGIDLKTFSKQQADEAEKSFEAESLLKKFLNDWNVSQRSKLKARKEQIETRAFLVSIAEYVLFAIGWLISIVDKAMGKPAAQTLGTKAE